MKILRKCQCFDEYVGKYCNCLESACPRSENGTVCGGHGECNICSGKGVSECTCNGDKQTDITHAKGIKDMEKLIKTCMCPLSDKECIDKKTEKVCFDR